MTSSPCPIPRALSDNRRASVPELHEIAYLASLPKAPNNYHPINNYENAFERRNWVIDRMFKNGFINKRKLTFKAKPINTYKRTNNI